jgi:hypothetical protein
MLKLNQSVVFNGFERSGEVEFCGCFRGQWTVDDGQKPRVERILRGSLFSLRNGSQTDDGNAADRATPQRNRV